RVLFRSVKTAKALYPGVVTLPVKVTSAVYDGPCEKLSKAFSRPKRPAFRRMLKVDHRRSFSSKASLIFHPNESAGVNNQRLVGCAFDEPSVRSNKDRVYASYL